MKAVLLDYSPFGNEHDRRSDLILLEAMKKLGLTARKELVSPTQFPRIMEDLVWFRYDVRSPIDLHWVVEKARKLEKAGHSVFPSSEIIRIAEDKWETWLAFKKHRVKTPPTFLATDLDKKRYPLIIKRRVGWGGMGNEKIFKDEDLKPVLAHLNEFFICQPFFTHYRTIIAAIARGRGITCIENMRGDPTIDGDVRVIPFPGKALSLAISAMKSLDLVAGTVDLIETPDGLTVLEVNASPRLSYPDLPGVDLATPMLKAVLAGIFR